MNEADAKKAFDDWKADAQAVDILEEARALGAKLRKTGTEWVGPCPACGGKDRFGVNPSKKVFICRGAAGGDVIAMTMHLSGVDFLGACEKLTSKSPPRGKSKELSQQQKDEIERKRAVREEESRKHDAEANEREARRAATAADIWAACTPIAGTLAEVYINARGIPTPPQGWPDCLGFHNGLIYELDTGLGSFPALIARVDDVGGDLIAIWREYLSHDGRGKAPVPNPKLGLGPAAGGAVRIGGVGRKIGVAEGLLTALAVWTMLQYKFPVWPTLSTSGMKGVEFPLEVEHVDIFPDGDVPVKKQGEEFVPVAIPPGRDAAQKLRARVIDQQMVAVIQAEPSPGKDYLDVYVNTRAMEETI